MIALLIAIGLLVLLIAGLLVAKFVLGGDSDTEPKPAPAPAAEPTPAAKAAELYAGVLDDIDSYQFLPEGGNNPDWDFDGYQYTLTEITGDDIPEMLVQTNAKMLPLVRVFAADLENNEVIAPAETLQIGVAGAGGFRGYVAGSVDGNSLYYTVFGSGTGDAVTETITISDGELSHATAGEYQIMAKPQEIQDAEVELEFVDVADRSLLEELADGVLAPASAGGDGGDGAGGDADAVPQAPAQPSAEELRAAAIAEAEAAGKQVYSGTVRVLSHEELLQLQGISDPNPGTDGGSTYVVLVFDGPTDVYGDLSGDPGQATLQANMLSLATHWVSAYGSNDNDTSAIDVWRPYDGQSVTVALHFLPVFPSDTRMPVGEPSAQSDPSSVIWPQ